MVSNSCQPAVIRDLSQDNQTEITVKEGQTVIDRFDQSEIHPMTAFDREILRRFRVYLSQIETLLSLKECWADFQQIYPELPDGKARWSRILCAVIIVLRVRSQSPSPIPLRTLLQKWDIKRSDYFHVIEKMEHIPLLHDWISNRPSPHRPTFSNLTQIMHQVAQTLAIDPKIVDCALDIIQDQRCVNRSEIQVLAALLAAQELHPEILSLSAKTICDIFPNVAKAHVITLKRRMLVMVLAKPEPIIPKVPVSPPYFLPRISSKYETPMNISPDVAIQSNDISLPQGNFQYLSHTFRSFRFAQQEAQSDQSMVDSTVSGKELNIKQRVIPHPLKSDE